MAQNDHATGACKTGVKVRITRQRMVGRIARHSNADIAAGVTPGHPWPFAPDVMQAEQFPLAANGRFRVTARCMVQAIMHSARLCAFGTRQYHCSLAGGGTEVFHAAHNFRAFGKSGRASLATFWRHLPTHRTDPMRPHTGVDAKLRRHRAASKWKLCSECLRLAVSRRVV